MSETTLIIAGTYNEGMSKALTLGIDVVPWPTFRRELLDAFQSKTGRVVDDMSDVMLLKVLQVMLKQMPLRSIVACGTTSDTNGRLEGEHKYPIIMSFIYKNIHIQDKYGKWYHHNKG